MKIEKNKIDAIVSKILLALTILAVISLLIFIGVSIYFLSPVNKNSDKMIMFEVESGWSKIKIADKLEEAGLIKNAFFFKFYMKINEHEMYAGTYNLSKSMTVDEIIKILGSGDSFENETVTITFIEGKRLTDYVKKISEEFVIDEDEIHAKLKDKKYLESLIEQYWFLTDDILNEEVYYPLEGFLFPDTYIIKKSSTIEEIIGKMLSTMDNKLSIYKDEVAVADYSIYEIVTLASIIELEGSESDDRAGVAGVFYNRLKDNWTLGSDVTTYYGAKKDFSTDLTWTELKECNPYNTRGDCAPGLPIGPIASPSFASITASIEPTIHEYYYFVADKHKKTYFNITEADHDKEIRRLKSEGLWYEY